MISGNKPGPIHVSFHLLWFLGLHENNSTGVGIKGEMWLLRLDLSNAIEKVIYAELQSNNNNS